VKPLTPDLVSLAAFAHELFTEYLLPFEIVGLLLLVAVIGATVAARRPPPSDSTPGLAPSGFGSGCDPRPAGPAEGSEP